MFNFKSTKENIVAAEIVDSKLHLFYHDGNSYKIEVLDSCWGILSVQNSEGAEEFSGRGPLRYFKSYVSSEEFEEAKKALDKGITEVVFDRGGFIYQGKIQALADAAREAGLQF